MSPIKTFPLIAVSVIMLAGTAASPEGKWFEAIKPAELQPQDLHEAQLRRRLSNTSR